MSGVGRGSAAALPSVGVFIPRQDDKPGLRLLPATPMEWIIGGIAALLILALVGLLIWKAKHLPGSVHGEFRFDSHKAGELSKRGLFDKTKW